MKLARTILCGVPATCWDFQKSPGKPHRDLQLLLKRCLAAGRRVAKGSNAKCEQAVYLSLLRELSQWALDQWASTDPSIPLRKLVQSGGVPAIELEGVYQAFLREVKVHETHPLGITHPQQIGSEIITPDCLPAHLKRVEAYMRGSSHTTQLWKRQNFMRLCRRFGVSGFVEVPQFLCDTTVHDLTVDPLPEEVGLFTRLFRWLVRFFSAPVHEAEAPVKESIDLWKRYSNQPIRGKVLRETLTQQIELAISKPNCSVNLGAYRHPLVTDALSHYLVKREPRAKPKSIEIVHSDGSTSLPFPLFVAEPLPDSWRPTRELHVGLISMRHLPLDRDIDFYWFTNLEVPSRGAGAEADRFCFERSQQNLSALRKRYPNERLKIYLYHTGFLPAVVGFYRAVAESLKSSSQTAEANWLQVVPVFGPKDTKATTDSFGFPWPATQGESNQSGVEQWVKDGTPGA